MSDAFSTVFGGERGSAVITRSQVRRSLGSCPEIIEELAKVCTGEREEMQNILEAGLSVYRLNLEQDASHRAALKKQLVETLFHQYGDLDWYQRASMAVAHMRFDPTFDLMHKEADARIKELPITHDSIEAWVEVIDREYALHYGKILTKVSLSTNASHWELWLSRHDINAVSSHPRFGPPGNFLKGIKIDICEKEFTAWISNGPDAKQIPEILLQIIKKSYAR